MEGTVSQDTIDELLANRAWLQRLARSLVGSAQVAEDLVQETYESALASPPDGDRAMRPWLRQVLRNAARMRWRSDARRARREQAVDTGESDPSPAELLARVRAHRRLAELVEELEEPVRATILLRYVEGLSAAEIARRTDTPAGTVRWRVKQGLELLRVALDRDSGGERTVWHVALVPLSAAAETAPAGGFLAGVFAMKMMTKLLAGMLLVGGIAIVAVVATRADQPNDAAPERAMASQHQPRARAAAPALTPSAEPTPADALPRRLPSVEARERLERDIARARTKRLARERADAVRQPTSKPGTPAGERPDFDKDYIHGQMQDLLPLIKECYEMALEIDPALGGKIVLDFNIVGEPDVGGVVESSEIDDELSTLKHPAMAECVRETVYALEVEPPPTGGSVRVRFPFTFSSDETDEP